jgi:hypothetical protein
VIKAKRLKEQIKCREGFEVEIKGRGGSRVRKSDSFRSYVKIFKKRGARQNWTVQKWKEQRFNHYYPGFEVKVLDGDGKKVPGMMKLRNLRDSYYAK